MKWSASVESPSSPLASSIRFVLPSLLQTETCAWQPLPVGSGSGLDMKVARSPLPLRTLRD